MQCTNDPLQLQKEEEKREKFESFSLSFLSRERSRRGKGVGVRNGGRNGVFEHEVVNETRKGKMRHAGRLDSRKRGKQAVR